MRIHPAVIGRGFAVFHFKHADVEGQFAADFVGKVYACALAVDAVKPLGKRGKLFVASPEQF